MTAAVIDLPLTRQVPAPPLSRDERRKALDDLAHEQVTGVPIDPWQALVLACALASPSLSVAEAAAKWAHVLGEHERFADWSVTDDAEWPERPGFFEADLQAALDDITDGTDRYESDRQPSASRGN